MLKKKDKLLQVLKNSQEYPILQYLSSEDLIPLSLAKKSYYLQILPQIRLRQLDSAKSSNNNRKNSSNTINKKHKSKLINSQEHQKPSALTLCQTAVKVEKFPISKWPQKVQRQGWQKLSDLPFRNSYLQKKIQSKCYIFFVNKESKQLLYMNRSMIDPSLDFEKGSFTQKMEDIYEHMHEDGLMQMDLSSRDFILKRQKEMLDKIKAKMAENAEKDMISYEKQLHKAIGMNRYAIILCFGGSFSLAIYQKSKCLIHRSDKKYVCRKKAGQRQFNKDKQSGSSIKSMGSQIRREQQKKHVINVNYILNQNREQLFKCQVIFLQAPGLNRLYIINQNQTIAQLQQKLRSVCLTAKKANFSQVQLINQAINTVHIVRIIEQQRQRN